MNFSGLPDEFKAGTRGQAPSLRDNNIFGYQDEVRNNNNSNQNPEPRQSPGASAEQNQNNQDAYERRMLESAKNRQHGQQQSNIFDPSSQQDFVRDNPYANNPNQQRSNIFGDGQQYAPPAQQNQAYANNPNQQRSNIFGDGQQYTPANQQNQAQAYANQRQHSNVFSNGQEATPVARVDSSKQYQQKRHGFNPITGEDYNDGNVTAREKTNTRGIAPGYTKDW